MSGVSRVHADLVSSAGRDRNLEQRGGTAERIDQPKLAPRGLAAGRNTDAGFARAPLRDERRRNLGGGLGPAPLHEREITLVDPAFAEQRMQRPQRATALG